MIFKYTKYPNAAKAYLQFMLDKPQYDPWLAGCLGYWCASARGLRQEHGLGPPIPELAIYTRASENLFSNGYGPARLRPAAPCADYVMVQMCGCGRLGQGDPGRRGQARPSAARPATTAA